MPTYEYECESCSYKFEFFQGIKAPLLEKCPKCKKLKLRRLVGMGAGIIFKGSGFYTTDYKKKESEKLATKSQKQDNKVQKSENLKSEPSKSKGKEK